MITIIIMIIIIIIIIIIIFIIIIILALIRICVNGLVWQAVLGRGVLSISSGGLGSKWEEEDKMNTNEKEREGEEIEGGWGRE